MVSASARSRETRILSLQNKCPCRSFFLILILVKAKLEKKMSAAENVLKAQETFGYWVFPERQNFFSIPASPGHGYGGHWVRTYHEDGALPNMLPRSPVASGFAAFVSFSSYSPSFSDGYNHARYKRPYQIVVLPDAEFVECAQGDIMSAMWVPDENMIDKPFVIWDGWSKEALFEIILECIAPICVNPRSIRVFDTVNRVYIEDTRDPEFLVRRPKVPDATAVKAMEACPYDFWVQRFQELYDWSKTAMRNFVDSGPEQQSSYAREQHQRWLQTCFVYAPFFSDSPYNNVDCSKRREIFKKEAKWGLSVHDLVARPELSLAIIEDSPDQVLWLTRRERMSCDYYKVPRKT